MAFESEYVEGNYWCEEGPYSSSIRFQILVHLADKSNRPMVLIKKRYWAKLPRLLSSSITLTES